jgi:hypothetical protein
MSTAQSRLESTLASSLYRLRSEEIRKYLKKLSEEYGEPDATHSEVRKMMDRSLGRRTLSSEVYKMREDQS